MDVDVAVLGGGPAGYTAAIRAAQLGARVACIEKEPELGGTCLRVGCIPTKAWVQTAHALHAAREINAKLGVVTADPQLDFAQAGEWKAGVVKQMTGGVASLFKANGVEWVKGAGSFKDANTIAVEGGEDVTFRSAIVATGSKGSTRRAASTRPASSSRALFPDDLWFSEEGSSAASSRPSSSASARR
jgi:dihydrolipoamide dehydrogenase